ncbi:MAG: ABC transporter permease subunit/CPBP intramembrane protease [Pirellulales bacterium]
MNWRNIRLIYAREIRDQLRDRRTLFMIAVLPLLLYPLLGMSVFQLSQFLRTTEPRVVVVGSEQLAAQKGLPKLFNEGRFAADLFDDPAEAERIAVEYAVGPTGAFQTAAADTKLSALEMAQLRLETGTAEVVLLFPPDFGQRLAELRAAVQSGVQRETAPRAGGQPKPPNPSDIPQPELLYNSTREKSRIANAQVEHILNSWKSQIVRENLLASRVPANIARPFELRPRDIAPHSEQQGRLWSKILPFVLFIWALTGAFYPAVDLCAGEKERGTLETLLSSPALRGEIVWGKLLTVMTFSAVTALLNLASLGITARYIITQLRLLPVGDLTAGLDMPPLTAAIWLVLALLPMSALFSALCLASAAFARSSKEGQYYLMPLLLVTMPLMMLPMAPGAELNLGNSLIPVTGVVLLLKGLVQGNYADVLRYIVPVCLVTGACCHLAIRWAVYQFNQETVLFRESERFDLRRWVVHLVRDRQATPSLAEVFFGVAIIYVIQFFMRLAVTAHMPASPDFSFLALVVFISVVVCIALPALLMTLVLTGRPRKTLLLDRTPRLAACAAAVLLATVLHPVGQQLVTWIVQLYPVQGDALAGLSEMLSSSPSVWLTLLLLAALPAVCEELAFRGFLLSGLRHLGNKWWAIGLSAVFFGFTHSVIQQSLAATAVGLVLGYIAVQTSSLIPCILFHMTYNSLMIVAERWPEFIQRWPTLDVLVQQAGPNQAYYPWYIVVICAIFAAALLNWFHRLPYLATKEERLSDARARQSQQPLVGSVTGSAE